MANMQVEVSASDAQRLAEPIEDAKRARLADRVCDLEFSLIKAQNALTAMARALEDFANSHASADRRTMTEEDVSAVYGIVYLLECTAAECGRAWGADDE